MISIRKIAILCAPLLVAAAVACGLDAPTQAPPAPSQPVAVNFSRHGGNGVAALLPCPASRSYSSSARIGSAGGILKVGPHRFVVPQGALRSTVTITADAPKGDYIRVHFEPEGLQFRKPASLTLSYEECGLVNGLLLKVVCVDDDLRILWPLPSVPSVLDRTVTGKVDHFSNYALAE